MRGGLLPFMRRACASVRAAVHAGKGSCVRPGCAVDSDERGKRTYCACVCVCLARCLLCHGHDMLSRARAYARSAAAL